MSDRVNESIDHLFRHHAGQMVSVLCRIFGFERIDLIEDSVQDALVSALRRWPFSGTPDNPTAWLIQTAKHRLIDRLRHESRSGSIDDTFDLVDTTNETPVFFPAELAEDQLRMIFACCHPSIPPDSQVALTLKIVGGFSVAEIAAAYLANGDAIAKMLTRAKSRLREASVQPDIPVANDISTRLDAVLKVLYLMFNEGYGASGGDELIRRDLCFEAIRLAEVLSTHVVTASPKTHAATALFCFQASRLPARTDHAGELILLADQDRTVWDKRLIGHGLRHLKLAGSGRELTTFHLEAEIAATYTLAESFDATDWDRILECYDLLQSLGYSGVAELNRIVVLSRLNGSANALAALERMENKSIRRYNLFHITRGYLLAELNDPHSAADAFTTALALTGNEAVRRFIERKLDELGSVS